MPEGQQVYATDAVDSLRAGVTEFFGANMGERWKEIDQIVEYAVNNAEVTSPDTMYASLSNTTANADRVMGDQTTGSRIKDLLFYLQMRDQHVARTSVYG